MNNSNNFTIMMVGYNSVKWIERSIESALNQKYDNFQVVAVDACTTDGTYDVLKQYETDKRFKLIRNTERKYQLENFCTAIDVSPDNTIMCALDFDDWLLRPDVLTILNRIYTEDVWLTYGNYVDYCSDDVLVDHQALSSYPDDVVKENRFRSDKWRASHLRTFRKKLFQMIDIKDFIDPNTKTWYRMSGDLGIMLPMLEMAGERHRFIDTRLYCYNKTNPLNDDKVSLEEQTRCANSLRNSPVYDRLERLDTHWKE